LSPTYRSSANPLTWAYSAGAGFPPTVGQRFETSYEGLLISSSHRRLKGGGWSGGGAFYTHKDTWTSTGEFSLSYTRLSDNTKQVVTMVAAELPGVPTIPVPPTVSSVWPNQQSDFTTGWKRTRPGNAVGGLGQALIEGWRDGLPRGPSTIAREIAGIRSVVGALRQVGNQYLNVVFGWKPLVNDLRKIVKTYLSLSDRLDQLRKDNGQGIRRRADLGDQTSTSSTTTEWTAPFVGCTSAPAIFIGGHTTYTTTTTTTQKTWYSARYRYYIPDTSSSQWTTRASLALFGALPTPEVLWEVMPWSWFIDWFTNMGDIISNASQNAVDNLVADYAYVMFHTNVTTTVGRQIHYQPANGIVVSGCPPGDATINTTHVVESKLRQGGLNPYGFGYQVGSLTGYQSSVLAALGISKQRLLT